MEISATLVITIIAIFLILKLTKKVIHKVIGLVLTLGVVAFALVKFGII